MFNKKNTLKTLIVICLFSYHPAPAHASFFLFNIIHDIFSGGNSKTTAATSVSHRNSTIKYGMRGGDVAVLQQYLIKSKYLSGTPNGVYDHQTLQAVKAFQRDSKLTDDGLVEIKTMSALRNFHGTRPSNSNMSISKPTYHPPINTNGVPSYLSTISLIATAYTRYDEGCTDYTYRGSYLHKGLCAVDPGVIPLGTRLYVPGYGEALADDIGGAIQGNRIDLAMDTLDEAFDFGRRSINVYVLPRA